MVLNAPQCPGQTPEQRALASNVSIVSKCGVGDLHFRVLKISPQP